jgi:hypothetical protein
MDRISAFRSRCDCCRAIARSGTPSAPTTCAGVHCPDLPAFFRASPRPSVAALGLHGFTIRIRVSRAGVDWRVIRRWVQDRVAARGVFIRSRQSGLSTRRAHNVVVGFLCADSVRLAAGDSASLHERQQVVGETVSDREYLVAHPDPAVLTRVGNSGRSIADQLRVGCQPRRFWC